MLPSKDSQLNKWGYIHVMEFIKAVINLHQPERCNRYLLNACSVPGSILGVSEIAMNKAKSLPVQNIYFNGAWQTKAHKCIECQVAVGVMENNTAGKKGIRSVRRWRNSRWQFQIRCQRRLWRGDIGTKAEGGEEWAGYADKWGERIKGIASTKVLGWECTQYVHGTDKEVTVTGGSLGRGVGEKHFKGSPGPRLCRTLQPFRKHAGFHLGWDGVIGEFPSDEAVSVKIASSYMAWYTSLWRKLCPWGEKLGLAGPFLHHRGPARDLTYWRPIIFHVSERGQLKGPSALLLR